MTFLEIFDKCDNCKETMEVVRMNYKKDFYCSDCYKAIQLGKINAENRIIRILEGLVNLAVQMNVEITLEDTLESLRLVIGDEEND